MYNKKHWRFNEQTISVYQTHILIKKKVSNNQKICIKKDNYNFILTKNNINFTMTKTSI